MLIFQGVSIGDMNFLKVRILTDSLVFFPRNLFGRRTQDSSLFVRSMHSCCFFVSCGMVSHTIRILERNFFKGPFFQGNFFPTVGGRNPAPVDMVNIPLFTGFYTSR